MIVSEPLATPFVRSADAAEAQALIDSFGADAVEVAAGRADDCRDRGNVAGYCRWRQIERLIALLSIKEMLGTLH